MEAALRKANGVHYTPPKLADFLASETVKCLKVATNHRQSLRVLDPACGNGQLLVAIATKISRQFPTRSLELVGYEIDEIAAKETEQRLQSIGHSRAKIVRTDFLESSLDESDFDLVISNPPYVRTQVLGSRESQRLAGKFGLTGRVDLYHAFAVAISKVIVASGALGLLTSNRFLTVKSGRKMRTLLEDQFNLRSVVDLGDSRLFEAAVLPVIVTGNRRSPDETCKRKQTARFCRVERSDRLDGGNESTAPSLLTLLSRNNVAGEFETPEGRFQIKRGDFSKTEGGLWTMANRESRIWLKALLGKRHCRFADLAEIKVGIKTTADAVFIRESWSGLGEECRPEQTLIHQLITHHHALRWRAESPRKSVLYPYRIGVPRQAIALEEFPRAMRYLNEHRERLSNRKYLLDAGREWFEIWVPHQPDSWRTPKIVWPDISEQPRFFLDSSGAIVNGDCYWIKLKDGVDDDWIFMMLAVANSKLAIRFYDTMFHNKLYANRRRFMTQYVKEFPLPALDTKTAKEIIGLTKRQVISPEECRETEIDSLVQQAFGF